MIVPILTASHAIKTTHSQAQQRVTVPVSMLTTELGKPSPLMTQHHSLSSSQIQIW